MPIYEYRCKKGHTFEVMQSFSDDHVTACEVCGAKVERVYHPIAVHFKGSGFYNTDYGTRKRAREMKDAKEGSSKSDGAKAATSASDSSSSGSSSDGSRSSSDSSAAKSDTKKSDSSSTTKAAKSK